MAEELDRHGYQISPGTLYPLLRRLKEDGLLESESEVVAGKMRKYYVATDKGRQALGALRPRLAELVDETLTEKTADVPQPRPGHKPRR
ncbi:Transcriptional regulator, PadR family (fragment) [Cupriavidus necator]|uniref:Transcriptional regulator, PadR family n=2 Tax=Cupriavidus necator TaxID=106590 RepID=A0A1K0JJ44_CUPNE